MPNAETAGVDDLFHRSNALVLSPGRSGRHETSKRAATAPAALKVEKISSKFFLSLNAYGKSYSRESTGLGACVILSANAESDERDGFAWGLEAGNVTDLQVLIAVAVGLARKARKAFRGASRLRSSQCGHSKGERNERKKLHRAAKRMNQRKGMWNEERCLGK